MSVFFFSFFFLLWMQWTIFFFSHFRIFWIPIMSLQDRSALSEQRDTFSKTLIVFISQCDRPFTPQNLACDPISETLHIHFNFWTAYTLLQLNHCMCTPHKSADLLSNLFDVSQMSVFNGPFRCLHHSVITRRATENEWGCLPLWHHRRRSRCCLHSKEADAVGLTTRLCDSRCEQWRN